MAGSFPSGCVVVVVVGVVGCGIGLSVAGSGLGGVGFFVRDVELGLGFVEGDVGDVFLRGGEVDGGLGGWVVAPGGYRVEVGDEGLGETGGEGFAAELGGEAGGEVLKHDQADEETVAGGPGGGLIAEEAELEREVGALDFD
jgi:hypothetical protein